MYLYLHYVVECVHEKASCGRNLKRLVNGTFSSCPSLFNQLLVIHGVKNSIYVPLFFCWLVGKSVTDYCTALEFLKKRSSILPTTFHIDFEQSIHSAVRLVWLMSKIKGFWFHLGQVWYRKIQSLGLFKVYSTEGENGNFLKSFFGLPFLSPNEVDDCFKDDFMSTLPAGCTAVYNFTDYVFFELYKYRFYNVSSRNMGRIFIIYFTNHQCLRKFPC
jgi:hypothetical protein